MKKAIIRIDANDMHGEQERDMRLSHRPYSRGILILLVIAATGLWMTSPVGAQPGGWSPTGSMQVGRHSHTATLLPNGTVLVVGGHDVLNSTIVLNSAEIYDASTGT